MVFLNKKQSIFVMTVGIALVILIGGGTFLLAGKDQDGGDGLKVVTTFYPLYYFASEIGGDRASVSMLIPENMEPHAWEPKVSDMLSVAKADVLVLNGGGLEPWAEDLLDSASNEGLVLVDTSKGMDLNRSEASPEDEHDHGGTDPHFWLDPLAAKVQVDNILEGFSMADPGNKDYYGSNAGSLKDRLDDLHDEFASGLENRTKDDIITTHEAFNYLAHRYGFHAHAAIGISGDEQPSVQDLSDLVKEIDGLGLSYVFVEPTFSDQYMEAISDETGATILVLDGLHGRTGAHSGMDYFQIMRDNLRNLQIGLEVDVGGRS